MDPLLEHGIISHHRCPENERVLDRLRRNDPTLKELSINYIYCKRLILQAFDAIATNSSLKILNIDGDVGVGVLFPEDIKKDPVTRALSLNTTLKDIRIEMWRWSWSGFLLDSVMASPNLEFLTIRNRASRSRSSIEAITAMAQVLRVHMNLLSLTFEGLQIDSDMAAAFATAFQENQTIKTLIMRRNSIYATNAVSFVEALPHDHALEVLVFDENSFDDDSLVRIVRTLCRTPLKVLSLADSSGNSEISQEGCTRIIQTLRENEHSLTKLDLFRHSQNSLWQNFIRLEIEKLTWNNCLQVERATWVDRFLEQDAPTKELLFRALKRAKNVDNERFAPNMLFYLIKESPDFIVQAIRDGLLMSIVTMSLPILAAQNTYEEGLLVKRRPSIRNKRRRDED